MTNHNNKIPLFVRVPKTGTSSIQACLEENNFFLKVKKEELVNSFDPTKVLHPETHYIEHIVDWITKLDKDIRKKFFIFCFVRNPWDKAVSSWKFGSWHSDWNMSFLDFCKYLLTFKGHRDNQKDDLDHCGKEFHALPCSVFTHENQSSPVVDFIGKFENLQEDFDAICDKIGIPRQELPHKNKSEHKHYTEYYDDETRAIVAEKYAKDIEYFGYKFGE